MCTAYSHSGRQPPRVPVEPVRGVEAERGAAWSHGVRTAVPVQQATWPAHLVLQGQGAADLGRTAPGVHPEARRHVPQGTRR